MRNAKSLIAVVDDEESVRKALERLIRSAGYSVAAYASGAEFLRSTQRDCTDCVVLDLHMPEINGFEVQAALSHTGARVPVVVITGDDSPESHARAMGRGAKAYLRKPVDGSTLLDAIRCAVDLNLKEK
jgi:FixJ family two-component response regulator